MGRAGGAPQLAAGRGHAAPAKAEQRNAPKLAAVRHGAAKPEEVIPLDDKELGNF